jgi:cysteine desulfurase
VDKDGFISLEELKNSIREDTILISIMFANNEIGTIEPIKEIGRIAKEKGIIFHTDCVQAVGNVKIDVKELGIDLLSLSSHKFYGPKGVGAIYINENVEFEKIQDGGHQEKNKRAGTENIAGIVGLAKAIELADKNLEKYNSKLITLRDFYFDEITKNILISNKTFFINFFFPFIFSQ